MLVMAWACIRTPVSCQWLLYGSLAIRQAYIDEENDDSVHAHKGGDSIHFPAKVCEFEDAMVQCKNTGFDEKERNGVYELVEVEVLEVRNPHRRHM